MPVADFSIGCRHQVGSKRFEFLRSSLPVIRTGWLARAEEVKVAQIEALRQQLLFSTVEISTVDFGAVDPNFEHPATDPAHGIERRERIGEICRVRSKDKDGCLFLFRLVRLLRPGACLELGTALGITAAYLASAMELNGSGSLVSIEGCPRLAAIAQQNLAQLELQNASVRAGRFQTILPPTLAGDAFDFVFIDGHHDGDATEEYFHRIACRAEDDSAVVFDDIRWSDGMKRAWRRISGSEKVRASAVFGDFGIVFTHGQHPV